MAHLKAHCCRAYAITEDAQLKRDRRQKLESRAHIGHLVGYRSTNIFRVWLPDKQTVISTRDVLFDETRIYEGQSANEWIAEAEMEHIIQKIELTTSEAVNEGILECR